MTEKKKKKLDVIDNVTICYSQCNKTQCSNLICFILTIIIYLNYN